MTPHPILSNRIARFDAFEVDLPAGHLRRHGIRLKLGDQSFRVLEFLMERAGEVVTREELRRRLWPENVHLDFDNGLNTAIARLREALGDVAERPRYIERLPKRGYRFIGTLAAAPSRPRLVVLPFLNLTGDPGQEYFSDAVTEEIIGLLANLAPEKLAVIARTTAMRYKGTRKDVRRIAAELHVDYLVEGSVVRNQQIVANVQLIRASDETHISSHRLAADPRDVCSLEIKAAQAIAEQFGILRAPVGRRGAVDAESLDQFMRGQYYLAKGTPDQLAMAKHHLQLAILRDPSFALAYDALAETYYYEAYDGFVPPLEALPQGICYALRALEIDNTLAETHALMAEYRKSLDFDWPEVSRELARALELNPASPAVRIRHATTGLMPHGRTEEAIAELQLALETDPLNVFARIWFSVMLLLDHRFEEALEQARILLQFDREMHWGHHMVGSCCRQLGRMEEAVAAHRRAVEYSGDLPLHLGWLGHTLGLSGKHGEARALLERLLTRASHVFVSPASIAWIYLGLGELNDFYKWCNLAVDARDGMIMAIKCYPYLDHVRDDSRYIAVLRRMNLEP